MAFSRTANALVVHPHATQAGWSKVRTAGSRVAGKPSADLSAQASEILGTRFDADRYLLSHCTIVASVTAKPVPNIKIGAIREGGKKINRKWAEYLITPETDQWINNNNDSFSREVLTASYRTFIGAQNFLEHVQVEDLSKGRIIDAALRDIGETLYVDILVATERKHSQLVADIESGRLNGLSMGCSVSETQCTKCGNVAVDETDLCTCCKYEKGNYFIDDWGNKRRIAELCFPPAARVVMGDGTRRAIEDIQIGDVVLSHTGHRREVTQTFERRHVGPMVALDVLGVPQTLRSTPNHPYWVLSQRENCQCGCGTPLKSVGKTFSHMEYTRSYVQGHNPSARGATTLQPQDYQFKEAGDLREGDMLLLPIPSGVIRPKDVSAERARLLGWFLAEGNYTKKGGRKVGVQFTLNAADEIGIAESLAAQLRASFPPEGDAHFDTARGILKVLDAGDAPTGGIARALNRIPGHLNLGLKRLLQCGLVTRREATSIEKTTFGIKAGGVSYIWSVVPSGDREEHLSNLPRVHLYDRTESGQKLVVCYNHVGATKWFEQHAGEYAGEKHLSPDAIYWPVPLQVEMLRGYTQGDGSVDEQDRHWVSSVSETLISQMQIVAARCGLWTSRQVIFNGKAVEMQDVVGGSGVPLDDRGWRPAHYLSFQPSDEASTLFEMRAGRDRGLAPAWRQHAGCMLYRVRGVSREMYVGPVHNIEVAVDHSYLVEGVAVHNCGHPTVDDPPGGVTFIEASWVGSPAFTGAVMRNIITPEEVSIASARKAAAILSSPPPEWVMGGRQKAATAPTSHKADFDFGDAAPADAAPADDAAKPEEKPKDDWGDLEESAMQIVRDRVEKRIRDEMSKKDKADEPSPEESTSTNENLNRFASNRKVAQQAYMASVDAMSKTASCEADLVNKVAILDQSFGMSTPTNVYRVALIVGPLSKHGSPEKFLKACQAASKESITAKDEQALVRLGRILDHHAASRKASSIAQPVRSINRSLS